MGRSYATLTLQTLGLYFSLAPLVLQEQKKTLLESVEMTKALVNCFVQPQYFPRYIQSSCFVPVCPTSLHYLHYNTEPRQRIVKCFGRWLALLRLCCSFGIVFSIYDLFGVECGQCACKYTHPIMLAVFVCQLSSLRGIDEELEQGGGMLLYVFGGRFVLTRVHTHTLTHTHVPICAPQPISDVRNCTLICIRIIDTSN